MSEKNQNDGFLLRISCKELWGVIGLAVATVLLVGIYNMLRGQPEPDYEGKEVSTLKLMCGADGLRALRHLGSGETATRKVDSKSYWNPSGIVFRKGESYHIQLVDSKATWSDATHEVSPIEGWWPKSGAVLWLSNASRALGMLRAPDQNLFVLMGAFFGKCEDERMCAKHFKIGSGIEFQAPADGEFCAYANDLPFTYGNNSGSVKVQVTRK